MKNPSCIIFVINSLLNTYKSLLFILLSYIHFSPKKPKNEVEFFSISPKKMGEKKPLLFGWWIGFIVPVISRC